MGVTRPARDDADPALEGGGPGVLQGHGGDEIRCGYDYVVDVPPVRGLTGVGPETESEAYTCPNERAQVKRCLYPSWLRADDRPQKGLCPPASILLLPGDPHTAMIATGNVVPLPEGQGGGSHPCQINNRRPKDNILVILIMTPRTVRPGLGPAP